MAKFVAENQEIERHLVELVELINTNGGFIHDDLVIVNNGVSLTIEAPSSIAEGEKIISTPDEQLLPLDYFDLALNGDDICIKSATDKATPLQIDLMEKMISLYNVTGKIADHRRNSTHSLFHLDRELLSRISEDKFIANLAKQDSDNFYLGAFLASRRLGRKMSNHNNEKHSVLMPAIDFLNHHPMAPGYIGQTKFLSTQKKTTPETGDECFVKYGKYDDHTILLSYGYPETKSLTVVSRPMEIDLPGYGMIEIQNRQAARHNMKKIPKQSKDIEGFLAPVAFNNTRKHMKIGCIWIPPKNAPRAMRRVLKMYITGMIGEVGFGTLNELVDEVEQKIIDNNLKYYSDLKSYLGNYIAKPGTEQIVENAKIMVGSQLRKITAYSFDAARS